MSPWLNDPGTIEKPNLAEMPHSHSLKLPTPTPTPLSMIGNTFTHRATCCNLSYLTIRWSPLPGKFPDFTIAIARLGSVFKSSPTLTPTNRRPDTERLSGTSRRFDLDCLPL